MLLWFALSSQRREALIRYNSGFIRPWESAVMGKKSRREAQKAEVDKRALAASKAAEAKAAKRTHAAKAEEAKGTLAAAKDAVTEAAGRVAELVTQAAQAVREHVVRPVVAAVKKPKKARFVREKKEVKTPAKAAPLPPRSTKASAKLMTKNVALPPKEGRASGPGTKPQ